MELIATVCPHCNGTMEVPPKITGREVLCLHCLEPFVVTAVDRAEAITLRPDSSPPEDRAEAETLRGDAPPDTGPAILGKVGRFELRRFLGQGAYGKVFLAHDPQLDREVALKVPRVAPRNEVEADRFLREARAASRLKHPNIVAIYEASRAGNTVYIASEFVDGVPLSARLLDEPLPREEAIRLVRDVALALDYAHKSGIVHRDVKPANVMLAQGSRPQIMDFGLAVRGWDENTVGGGPVGTPAYMAPEQARGEEAGPTADVYALGVVLYELLTGRRPFEATRHLRRADTAEQLVPSPRLMVPDVSLDLEAVCLRATARRTSDRYATAGELAEELTRCLEGRAVLARPVGSLATAARWATDNSAGAFLIFALVASLLLGIGPAFFLTAMAAGLALPRCASFTSRSLVAIGLPTIVIAGVVFAGLLVGSRSGMRPDLIADGGVRVAALPLAAAGSFALIFIAGITLAAWDAKRRTVLWWWYAAVVVGAVGVDQLAKLASTGWDAKAVYRAGFEPMRGATASANLSPAVTEQWRVAAVACDRLVRVMLGLPLGILLGAGLQRIIRAREPGWAAYPVLGMLAAVSLFRLLTWVQAGAFLYGGSGDFLVRAGPLDTAVVERRYSLSGGWVGWAAQVAFPTADAEFPKPQLDPLSAVLRLMILFALAVGGAVVGAVAGSALVRVRVRFRTLAAGGVAGLLVGVVRFWQWKHFHPDHPLWGDPAKGNPIRSITNPEMVAADRVGIVAGTAGWVVLGLLVAIALESVPTRVWRTLQRRVAWLWPAGGWALGALMTAGMGLYVRDFDQSGPTMFKNDATSETLAGLTNIFLYGSALCVVAAIVSGVRAIRNPRKIGGST